jgi:hypothetical protein
MPSLSEIYFRNIYEVELALNKHFTFSLIRYTSNPFFKRAFAIITAGNPNNQEFTSEENRKRNALLYKDLNSDRVFKARGCYLEHCEDGYLVYDLSLHDALVLGRKYEQVAIFYNDTNALMYVECESENIICERKVD